jgi:hypothetical protein
MDDIAYRTFPCRNPIGIRDNDRMVVNQSYTNVSLVICSDNLTDIPMSVHLTPEDALRLAKVILEIADNAASNPID